MIEIPNGISRVAGRKIPPISQLGSEKRTVRWSVDHRNVANDWRKKRSPPVASSWLTAALPRMGEMIRTWTAIPRSAPRASATPPPTQTGQPYTCTVK